MALTPKNTNMLLEYLAETTRGTPLDAGQLQIPSDAVSNVALSGTNNGEIVYTIGDYDGQDTVMGLKEYTLSFEYDLQRDKDSTPNNLATSLEYYAITRSSGLLTPLTFYLHVDSDTTAIVKGGIINTYSVSCSPGELIHCSVEVSSPSIAFETGNYPDLTASAAYATTFEHFMGASVTRSGSIEAGVGDFSFTINNNASGIPKIGSFEHANYYEGLENLEGNVGILINDGGDNDWNEMKLGTESSIVFASGTSATSDNLSKKWTFVNAIYSDFPLDFSAEDTYILSGVTWKAETGTLAVYS